MDYSTRWNVYSKELSIITLPPPPFIQGLPNFVSTEFKHACFSVSSEFPFIWILFEISAPPRPIHRRNLSSFHLFHTASAVARSWLQFSLSMISTFCYNFRNYNFLHVVYTFQTFSSKNLVCAISLTVDIVRWSVAITEQSSSRWNSCVGHTRYAWRRWYCLSGFSSFGVWLTISSM